MTICYAIVAVLAGELSTRTVLMAIAALNAVVLLAPPLVSTDIFSYQAYARMGSLFGINPYLSGPHALGIGDPVFPYIGSKWSNIPSVYGPVFTVFSYLLAPLAIGASVLVYKSIAARLEPRDRGAGLQRRATARRQPGQGRRARRAQPAAGPLRRRRRPQRPADAAGDGRGGVRDPALARAARRRADRARDRDQADGRAAAPVRDRGRRSTARTRPAARPADRRGRGPRRCSGR